MGLRLSVAWAVVCAGLPLTAACLLAPMAHAGQMESAVQTPAQEKTPRAGVGCRPVAALTGGPAQAGRLQTERAQTARDQTEPGQAQAEQTRAGRTDSQQPSSLQADSSQANSPQVDSLQAGPEAAESPPTERDVGQEICIEAHVYEVVELADGTRFLDVCPAALADEDCRFTLLSQAGDRAEVGDLRRFRNQNIRLRGKLRSIHGRLGMEISHARQFRGGPEKFRPNPRLLREFNGQSDRLPVQDPNLVGGGHHRSFMNSRDRESPAKH